MPDKLRSRRETRDPQDKSLIETALREAHEEVDIPPSMVSVIGQLAPLRSSEGYLVTPHCRGDPQFIFTA